MVICNGIASLECPILLPEVGAIDMQGQVDFGEGFSDRASLGQDNDLELMTQAQGVPSVGKGRQG